jgi:hypothetical protein
LYFSIAIPLVLVLLTPGYSELYYSRLGPHFSIGVKGGAVLSNLWGHGTDVLEDELRVDFSELGDIGRWTAMGGMFAALHFSDFAAVQLEVVYNRLGKRYVGVIAQTDRSARIEIDVDYLTFPVVLKLMIPFIGDGFRPHLIIGPFLSARLEAKVDKLETVPPVVDNLGILERFRADADADEETRAVDAGITMGLGVDIRLGPGYCQLELRGSSGFVNIFDDGVLGANAEEIRSAALWFTVGYLLEL